MFRLFGSSVIIKRSIQTCQNVIKSPIPDINILKNIFLQEYFLNQIDGWTDKVALECAETKRSFTYNEVRNVSVVLAHFLRDSLRLEEKSCAGVLLPNLPEYPISVLAAIQAGLTVTTINPNYTEDEITKQLVSSNVKVLFGTAERELALIRICNNLRIPIIAVKANQNSTLSAGTINFSDFTTCKRQNLNQIYTKSVTSKDVVFLPFSSGTTGLSKGVQLTHNNLVANMTQMVTKEFECFARKEEEIVLAFLPFFHIYGLVGVLLHGLFRGVKLITFPKFTSQLFVKSLREYRPTCIPSVPPIIHLINNSPLLNSEDLFSVQSIICGAAPLGETDVLQFKDATNGKIKLLQGYGMTETVLNVIQTPVLKGGVKIGGSGYLLPNTEAKFISVENLDVQVVLGPNQTGELLIRGPQVMKGYLNNPQATKEMITDDGWLKSGDIGHYDEDGHIFITDRLKELIKVQGFQVAPAELETIIRKHPAVADVAVTGMKHKRLGEVPRAFVVRKDNARLRPGDIEEFVAKKVVKYKHLVGGVTFLNEIPKTPSGKILRKELKKFI